MFKLAPPGKKSHANVMDALLGTWQSPEGELQRALTPDCNDNQSHIHVSVDSRKELQDRGEKHEQHAMERQFGVGLLVRVL